MTVSAHPIRPHSAVQFCENKVRLGGTVRWSDDTGMRDLNGKDDDDMKIANEDPYQTYQA